MDDGQQGFGHAPQAVEHFVNLVACREDGAVRLDCAIQRTAAEHLNEEVDDRLSPLIQRTLRADPRTVFRSCILRPRRTAAAVLG